MGRARAKKQSLRPFPSTIESRLALDLALVSLVGDKTYRSVEPAWRLVVNSEGLGVTKPEWQRTICCGASQARLTVKFYGAEHGPKPGKFGISGAEGQRRTDELERRVRRFEQ
jgi:hypothetical protein